MKAWLAASAFAAIVAAAQPSLPLADAHVHLSMGGADDLEKLVNAGITVVRYCGGDLTQLPQWRDQIAKGQRRGPKIYIAGPLVDGPKPGAHYRLTVRTPEDAAEASGARRPHARGRPVGGRGARGS